MFPLVIQEIDNDNDRQFAERLYTDYRRLMLSEIKKIVNDNWDAEDVMQNALIKLMDRLELLRTLSRSHLVNYIITTCRNTAISLLREKKRAVTYSFDETFDSLDESKIVYIHGTMEDQMIEEADRDLIYRVWCGLPPETRELLNAKYVLRQPDEEIAKTLGIKKNSVRMALTRAKRVFRERIYIKK